MADPQFLTTPAAGVITVTPSDSTVLKGVRGLYVGGAGAVAVTMQDGSTATFSAVPVGAILPVQASKVNAATTATLIVAFI